jgi:hypothetical protein
VLAGVIVMKSALSDSIEKYRSKLIKEKAIFL